MKEIKFIFKMLWKTSKFELLTKVFQIVINTTLPIISTILLGIITKELVLMSFTEKLIIVIGLYAFVLFINDYIFSYTFFYSNKLDIKIALKMKKNIANLLIEVDNINFENPEFIYKYDRVNDFISNRLLKLINGVQRIVVIIFSLINYSILICFINPLFLIVIIICILPSFLVRRKYIFKMRKMYVELQEERKYQNYFYNSLSE